MVGVENDEVVVLLVRGRRLLVPHAVGHVEVGAMRRQLRLSLVFLL